MLLKTRKEAYVIISLFLICISCKKQEETIVQTPIDKIEQQYKEHLNSSISALKKIVNSNDKDSIKLAYLEARKGFKYAEPVLAYVDAENYKFLNQPNITKVEEDDFTDIKIKRPSGFQVLEEYIYADEFEIKEIKYHAEKTRDRLIFTQKNANLSFLKDYHFLWIIRDAIVRVSLTGVTGFDSPMLENSLEESKWVYNSLNEIIVTYKDHFTNKDLFGDWNNYTNSTAETLVGEFNEFDRYNFMKNHTFKGLELYNKTVEDWNITFPFERAIKNNAVTLYGNETFNKSYFSSERFDSLSPEIVKLGKTLFHDTSLSTNNTISCASCHAPEKQYTDGFKIGKNVTRNTPSLLYASLQKSFFYDNRSGSLEGQIISVVENENEFHSNLEFIEQTIKKNEEYNEQFAKLYVKGVTQDNVRNAIATFIRSLTPFNSKFDKNVNSELTNLTPSEVNGFNLFHGKAKCATCHFPPTYNGTVPTLYKESEMELIGVPKSNDTINATIDDDLGAYYVYKTPERKHFFKTPTIRNADLTAPYMHNGVYTTLEEVVDFYNRGGGAGIGIKMEGQTLPPDRLNLSEREINDLIVFMKTLNDPVVN